MLSAWDIQNIAYISIVSANDYKKEIMTREKAGMLVNLYRGYENEHSNNEYIKKALIDYLSEDKIVHSLDMHSVAKREFLEFFEENILMKRRGHK